MEKSLKSLSINNGLILGMGLAVVTVLIYAVNLDLFTEWWLGIILFLVALGMGTYSAIQVRRQQEGLLSFKEAFSAYFITIAVGSLISSIIGIVIFTFVDPEAAQYLNEQILILTKETMESFGAPKEVIQEAMVEAEKKDNFSVMAQLQSYFWRLLFYSIFGLIVALIVKRNNPAEE
jgi:c-di-AMP phosphodiesterase-like protein